MSHDLHNPDFWDRNADYRTIVQDFTQFYSRKAWELAQVPHGASVLDIAAGGGALTQYAAAAGHDVLATDFSDGMVEAVAARDWPNVTARVMDGQALDLADDSFDAAFSMFGIMLFPDWEKGLAELVRVVRPGGIACIGTWKEKGGAAVNLLIDIMARRQYPAFAIPDAAPGMTAWTDQALFSRDMAQAGLRDVRFHEVISDFRIDLPMLQEPERTFQFSPIWPLLSSQEQNQLLEEMRDLAQRNGGIVEVTSPAIIAIGIKTDV